LALAAVALLGGFAAAQLPGLVVTGNPESDSGARWTYRDTVNDTLFDLAGVLFKPAGSETFPAIVLSHGRGGNASGIGANLARAMRPWGLVCIATNYTHAGGVAVGSPGDTSMPGASFANVQRAMACRRILASLGWVDTTRLAAHGHSMGAFLTGGLTGAHPTLFRVASHTAGGVNDGQLAWTKSWQAESITCPYQLHHGDADPVVPLRDDQRFDSILAARAVARELVVYPGRNHNIASDTGVLRRVRDWYAGHGLFDSLPVGITTPPVSLASRTAPTAAVVRGVLSLPGLGTRSQLPGNWVMSRAALLDAAGRKVLDLKPGENDVSRLAPGVYFVREQGPGARGQGGSEKVVIAR
jgi:dienelactone hydrolase